MFANLSGAHLVVILAVVLLFFGAPKLPALARSLGQSIRVFQREVRDTEPTEVGGEGRADNETSGDVHQAIKTPPQKL